MIIYDAAAFAADPNDPDAAFWFDEMAGAFLPKQKQLEVIVRPGRPGETFRNTGRRAVPSIIETRHCVLDRLAAIDAVASYETLLDGVAYEVYQHGQSWGYFRVRHFTHLPVLPIRSVLGTLIANATIVQRIQWELISTIPPEAP